MAPVVAVVRVSTNVRRLREGAGLSQETLAERAGLPPRAIQRAEAGANVRVSTVDALARGLGVDVVELFAPVAQASSRRGSGRPRRS